jgi:hypothetical protein
MDVDGKPDDGWLQERFARWLDAGMRTAFIASLLTFGLYVSGLVPARIALSELPRLWTLPLPAYLERTASPTGWSWLQFLAYGDFLSYAGIALFAVVIIVCDLAIILPLLRRRERLLAVLASVQVVILVAAASGRFAGI